MRHLRILAIESPGIDPRRSMAHLAARFPGALREIDELSLEEIDAKLSALTDAIADASLVAQWMQVVALFHALTRGALSAKRWLAGRKEVDDALRAEFERCVGDLPYGADARAWIGHLSALASPPRGRVTDLVFARIALELGVREEDARRFIFRSSS